MVQPAAVWHGAGAGPSLSCLPLSSHKGTHRALPSLEMVLLLGPPCWFSPLLYRKAPCPSQAPSPVISWRCLLLGISKELCPRTQGSAVDSSLLPPPQPVAGYPGLLGIGQAEVHESWHLGHGSSFGIPCSFTRSEMPTLPHLASSQDLPREPWWSCHSLCNILILRLSESPPPQRRHQLSSLHLWGGGGLGEPAPN